MDIRFHCQSCRAKIKADTGMAGEAVTCPACAEAVVIPAIPLDPGAELGGYEIKRRLGSGAMGDVFLATQPGMERNVALKVLSSELTDDEEYVGRFNKEVQVLGKLSHPNIVSAFEAGKDAGHHYLAMQYVDGETLEDILENEGALPEKKALKIIYKIARALQYAWEEMQILHRDIKPGNIMLDSGGEPRLMDLGISKSVGDETSHLTLTGFVVGTPSYMSPEQARGTRDLDCRSDIYALGATLYHMVTGDLPYDGTSTLEVMTRLISEPYQPAKEKNPELSDGTSVLIDRMMARSRDDRYRNWNDMLADLRRHLANKPLKQEKASKRRQPETAPQEHSSTSSATLWCVISALLLLCIGLIVGAWLIWGGGT